MLDGTGYTALPKEREDFVEERTVAEDTGDALEPVLLAEKGIDDVDLDRGIVPKVGDGAGRSDIGEDEMIVIPRSGRALRIRPGISVSFPEWHSYSRTSP